MSDLRAQIKVGLEPIAHMAEAGALSPGEWDALARLAALVTEDEFLEEISRCAFHSRDELHRAAAIKSTFEHYMRLNGLDVFEWWVRISPRAEQKSVVHGLRDVSWLISARLVVQMTRKRLSTLPEEFAPTLSEQSELRRKHESEGPG